MLKIFKGVYFRHKFPHLLLMLRDLLHRFILKTNRSYDLLFKLLLYNLVLFSEYLVPHAYLREVLPHLVQLFLESLVLLDQSLVKKQ